MERFEKRNARIRTFLYESLHMLQTMSTQCIFRRRIRVCTLVVVVEYSTTCLLRIDFNGLVQVTKLDSSTGVPFGNKKYRPLKTIYYNLGS